MFHVTSDIRHARFACAQTAWGRAAAGRWSTATRAFRVRPRSPSATWCTARGAPQRRHTGTPAIFARCTHTSLHSTPLHFFVILVVVVVVVSELLPIITNERAHFEHTLMPANWPNSLMTLIPSLIFCDATLAQVTVYNVHDGNNRNYSLITIVLLCHNSVSTKNLSQQHIEFTYIYQVLL